jgi:hypothetical protein
MKFNYNLYDAPLPCNAPIAIFYAPNATANQMLALMPHILPLTSSPILPPDTMNFLLTPRKQTSSLNQDTSPSNRLRTFYHGRSKVTLETQCRTESAKVRLRTLNVIRQVSLLILLLILDVNLDRLGQTCVIMSDTMASGTAQVGRKTDGAWLTLIRVVAPVLDMLRFLGNIFEGTDERGKCLETLVVSMAGESDGAFAARKDDWVRGADVGVSAEGNERVDFVDNVVISGELGSFGTDTEINSHSRPRAKLLLVIANEGAVAEGSVG